MKNINIIENLIKNDIQLFVNTIVYLSSIGKNDFDKLRLIIYNSIKSNENEGQYGYYITDYNIVYNVYKLLKKYKIKSIVDLGSGIGHFVSFMNSLGIQARGIEIEESLVTFASKLSIPIEKGDITKPFMLRNNEEAVYFYEPMFNRKLQEKFVKNLEQSLKINEYIFYNCTGATIHILNKSKCFKQLNKKADTYPIYIFKKVRNP